MKNHPLRESAEPQGQDSASRALLTKQESAAYARVSLPTLDRWRKSGLLSSIKLGRGVRIAREDLEKFVGKSLGADSSGQTLSHESLNLPNEKVARHFARILPYIIQTLNEAPEYGEISLAATVHNGEICRVRIGSDVSLSLSPREAKDHERKQIG